MFSPLDQFKIEWLIRIYNYKLDLSISNITIYSILTLIIILSLQLIFNEQKLIGNNYTNLIIIIINSLEKQIIEIVKNKGKKYIPFLISIFSFILISNFIGLIPYSTCITSQIIITLTFSLSIFLGVTYLGIQTHGYKFYKLFVPSNVPVVMLPLIILIELISYFARIISLSVRLAANLLAGHALLKILGDLGLNIFHFNKFLIFLPIILIFFIFCLEFGVAIIQAAVFTILTASYIKDSLYLH